MWRGLAVGSWLACEENRECGDTHGAAAVLATNRRGVCLCTVPRRRETAAGSSIKEICHIM